MCRVLLVVLFSLLAACAEVEDVQNKSLSYALSWFQHAQQDPDNDHMCHAMGLLKHSQFSCQQYQAEASTITIESRELKSFLPRECFESVCGEFYELEFSGLDKNGNEAEEILVLKRDKQKFRVYWYRSQGMLQNLQRQADQQKEQRDPLQVAYDQLTQTHPSLYQFPPCLGARASSRTLLVSPQRMNEIDPEQIEAQASQCDGNFCFTLIGEKIAGLCLP